MGESVKLDAIQKSKYPQRHKLACKILKYLDNIIVGTLYYALPTLSMLYSG